MKNIHNHEEFTEQDNYLGNLVADPRALERVSWTRQGRGVGSYLVENDWGGNQKA